MEAYWDFRNWSTWIIAAGLKIVALSLSTARSAFFGHVPTIRATQSMANTARFPNITT
jgi:hypothetical protein